MQLVGTRNRGTLLVEWLLSYFSRRIVADITYRGQPSAARAFLGLLLVRRDHLLRDVRRALLVAEQLAVNVPRPPVIERRSVA